MRNIFLTGIALAAFFSCTKTITPALNAAAPKLVIQGAISDTAGPYYISIVNSVGFYADNVYAGVSGAVITITDSTTGLLDMLTETKAGMYKTQKIMQGVPGHTYLLNVSLNGMVYTASSTMPKPVLLDSISFDVSDTQRIRPQANYQDPKGIVNFYKYSLVINGVVDKRFQTFSDRLSDGRYIQDKVDADTSEFRRYNRVQLSMVGIDKKVYTYLSEAGNVAYNNNNIAAPANPASNISGGCFGYFSAQTVSSKTRIIIF
jgi:hypothetical protein